MLLNRGGGTSEFYEFDYLIGDLWNCSFTPRVSFDRVHSKFVWQLTMPRTTGFYHWMLLPLGFVRVWSRASATKITEDGTLVHKIFQTTTWFWCKGLACLLDNTHVLPNVRRDHGRTCGHKYL